MRFNPRLLLFFSLIFVHSSVAASSIEIGVDDIDIPVYEYAGDDDSLPGVLWLPPHRGLQPPMHSAADALAALGISVWLADLHTAYFVDHVRSSIDVFEPAVIAGLIDRLHQRSGRNIVVMGGYRGTKNVLESIRAVQKSGQAMVVRGAILMSPLVLGRNPEPGSPAPVLPAARATNVPLYVIQPEVSTQRWRVEDIIDELRTGGAPVFLHYMPDTQGGFVMRPEHDLTQTDLDRRANAPFLFYRAVELMAGLEPPSDAAPLLQEAARSGAEKNRYGLMALEGQPPSDLELADTKGVMHALTDYAGKTTIVSFWASWCDPCIKELPSLRRLYESYRDQNLAVVTVNVGESAEQIEETADRHQMNDYALLMDPRGDEMRKWNVYGFPTNFVVDADGNFRLGSFGGVEWDEEDVRAMIEMLLDNRYAISSAESASSNSISRSPKSALVDTK